MKENNTHKNPWTPKDEGDHYPSMKEWWCIETLFKTLDDNRKWNLKASIAYELETPSCFFANLLFDITSNKCVIHKTINDNINKFIYKKNKVDLKYEKFTMKGLWPEYNIQIADDKQDIHIDMKYIAKIPAHWSAQDITNGYLPIGLDHYRYGWLINCDLTGSMIINGKTHKIEGKGYLEHAYGDWSYSNPFQKLSGFRKTFSVYNRLMIWRLSHNKPKIPDKISFTTENNPFGYDWFWGVFDNDWSIFYGNSMLWVNDGPAFGVLTLFDENGKYIDFCDIEFHYDKVIYIKKYDMYYPTDITLTARLDDKKIQIKCLATCDSYEYIDPFPNDRFYKAFILCEMPGKIEGVYSDNEKTVKLVGDCKHVPQRQPSVLGHNSLEINILKPPKGVGISFKLDSHYLKKKICSKIQLVPKPKIQFNLKKIN